MDSTRGCGPWNPGSKEIRKINKSLYPESPGRGVLLFKMVWRFNVKDKVKVLKETGEEILCVPHCIPHKLPFTESIKNECCHYHNATWRMCHHIPFCKYLRCPNFKRMLEAYKKRNKTQ